MFLNLNKLESLVEKLQSKKKKCIEISKDNQEVTKPNEERDVNCLKGISPDNHQEAKKQIIEQQTNKEIMSVSKLNKKVIKSKPTKYVETYNNKFTNTTFLSIFQTLIYIIILSLAILTQFECSQVGIGLSQANIVGGEAKRLLEVFVRQAAGVRNRWTDLPDFNTNNLNNNRFVRLTRQIIRRQPASNEATSQLSPIRRTIGRIRNRIGARNTIRVHNAFRDLAWRLLSSFSMPTPVIYELRRQHLYPSDEDEKNDSLHNQNTTKTIRTKRHFEQSEKSARSDDDDDDDSFRTRLRLRLEDLASLSRRSLFGRVVRIPSIIPFKRHQQEPHKLNQTLQTPQREATKQENSKTNHQPRLSRASWRRKRKEADKQMIIINGKQYYVNDDGELKEWKEEKV